MSTETKIQRYSLERGAECSPTFGCDAGMLPRDDGSWIKHTDHLAAVEEARESGFSEAREAAAQVVESCNRSGPYDAIQAAPKIRALRPAEKGEKA